MYNHEHWLNLRQLWTGFPDRELEGTMKWYYLVQFAFWLQQILVVNIEERRKDYHQMLAHHIITCVLIFGSYGYHQTKAGNLILCLMDIGDIFLAVSPPPLLSHVIKVKLTLDLQLAKILRYMRFRLACDIVFGVFMLVWLVARHALYLMVVYSIYRDVPEQMPFGCYTGSMSNLEGPFEQPDDWIHLIEPFRDPVGMICMSHNIKWSFFATLLALQVLLVIWFGLIVGVAVKVIRGGDVEDSRSDDEGDGEDEDERHRSRAQSIEKNDYGQISEAPLEEEVGVEAINLSNQRSSPAKRFRKGGGTASGVTLPSDRKELLGRIGCDKGS